MVTLNYVAYAVNMVSIENYGKWWTRPCLINNEWHIWSNLAAMKHMPFSKTKQFGGDSIERIVFATLENWLRRKIVCFHSPRTDAYAVDFCIFVL